MWTSTENGIETTPTGSRVAYARWTLDSQWSLSVERRLDVQSAGPTRVVMRAIGDDPVTDGIKFAHFRKIPIEESRRILEDLWIADQAGQLLDRLPDPFEGASAHLRLAWAFVRLREWGVRNPVAVIAKARPEAGSTTWASRIKRCRASTARGGYGYITEGADEEVTLTSVAVAALGDRAV